MGRCTNDALLNKIGVNKIDKAHLEIDFAVLTDVNRCMKINARNYIDYAGESVTYNMYRTPEDQFNCLAVGCRNTGTLMVSGATGESVSVKYSVGYDATEFYAGVVTYYVYFSAAGTYTLKTTMSAITDQNQSDSDVYEQEITVGAEGFHPVVVDFSKVPQAQNGNGWEASTKGAIITSEIVGASDALLTVGFSSYYFYDTIEDFEVNDVVKVSCLSEIARDLSVDPVDASCWGSGHDPSSASIEVTITGGKVTPNYWKLNPLMRESEKTTGWFIQSDEREVSQTTIDGVEYGYVQVPDMYVGECAFTTAAISDKCNVTDSTLSRVNTPVIVDLNERQFIVLDGTTTDPTDAGMILLHPSLTGLKVVVSYPKQAVIEQRVATDDALNGRRVRMSFPVIQTDGVKVVYVYNNILITSFPGTINAEETSFNFTFSIQRDQNGVFYEENRIIE